ncbi:MAG: PQQ-like beta-propeller repeat protein, partial [Phycisphaerales bacterium]
MKIRDMSLILAGFLLVPACRVDSSRANDWPTLHRDYQRSGFTDEIVRGPYERKWYRDFHREMIATRVEAIVADGKCFVGTFAGNMHALDVTNGRTRWTFAARGPIGASPCYAEGRLYFGIDEAFDRGRLYCVDADDGSLVWRCDTGAGIWVAPACDGQRVYFGDRAGVFHAVDARTGEELWTFATRGMILKPASFSLDGQKIIFGSEDMHVYCLDPNGKLLWRSPKLAGLSLRDQGPTIWQGLAIVRTNPADSFHTVMDRNGALLKQIQQAIPNGPEDKVLMDKWGDLVMRPTPRRRQTEQDAIVRYLQGHPYDRCFYAFDLADGIEPWIALVLHTVGLHNPPTPPTFNPQTGELYTFGRSAMTYYLRGVRRYNVLGRIDRRTGRFNLYWPSSDDDNWYVFPMIGDETQSLSLMGHVLIGSHQGMLGGLDLRSMKAMPIWAGRDTYGGIFGPAALEGGFQRAQELAPQGYLVGMPNEWHGPDRSICAVAQGRLLWVVGSQVVCIAGPDVPKVAGGGTEPPALKMTELPWCVAGGNMASRGPGRFDESVEKVALTPDDLRRLVDQPLLHGTGRNDSALAAALRSRLERQILELIEGGPWAPFIVQLGISGEERHFWRTAETMQTVALALPYLKPGVRQQAVAFLDRLWDSGVPLQKPVHGNGGKRREPFDLGPEMKNFAGQLPRYEAGVEDLYAVWAYACYADRWDRVERDIDKVSAIVKRFAQQDFQFNHTGRDDEAERLNGQLAGVLAAVRLFKHAGKDDEADLALAWLVRLAAERVHHERADTRLIRSTKAVSKGLHG